jgi:hypothetical protein
MAYVPNYPAQSADRSSIRHALGMLMAILIVGATILLSAGVMAHQPESGVCTADIC